MIRKITKEELVEMVCDGKPLRIVDVLDRSHYEQEHVKGAESIPLAELRRRANAFHRDDRIVVYCGSFECMASTSAAETLNSMGFTNVVDYKGGIKDWSQAKLPMEGSLHVGETTAFPCHASV